MSKHNRAVLILILLHVGLLAVFVFYRYADRDEGFYLSAAQQVALGKTLYTDFFFPQMPYLPAIQSIAAGHGFSSLYLSRLLGLVPAILTLFLFLRILLDLSANLRTITLAFSLYALSGMAIAWHSCAKTYTWTDLFLLMAFWGLMKVIRTGRSFWLAVASISLAMAANFRLVLAAAVIPFAYCIWTTRRTVKRSGYAAAPIGVIAVSLPTLSLFVHSPGQFWFDNFGFHLIRDPALTFWPSIIQRMETVGKLLINPQWWPLGLAVIATVICFRKRRGEDASLNRIPVNIAAAFAIVLTLAYLLPSPVHVQYFEQVLPFLVITAVPGIEALVSDKNLFARIANRTLIRISAVALILGLIPYLVLYLGAVRESDRPYALSNLRQLCDYVRTYPEPGTVYSEWSGISALSGRESVPGLDFVGFDYPLPIPDSRKRSYHIPVNDDLGKTLSARIPALYIVWGEPDRALKATVDSNYHCDRTFDTFVVFVRNGNQ